LHTLVRLAFIGFIAVITVGMYALRPRAVPQRRNRVIGLLVLGAIVGIIFLATQTIYAPAPQL